MRDSRRGNNITGRDLVAYDEHLPSGPKGEKKKKKKGKEREGRGNREHGVSTSIRREISSNAKKKKRGETTRKPTQKQKYEAVIISS